MTKSDSKSEERGSYQPKSYEKKTVNPGQSAVSDKSYRTNKTKKGKSYGKQPKTPSNIERESNPRKVDLDKKK